ncbi:Glycogen-binding subunit 76A [Folsomia candida]|uniref:Glycogen-binding subunit 76A n=1 Tax=Folsomia candida TaxID=158441 RepID=A0A226DXG1_FOLCA|nr:Glycogen-binding subunit 76A [Folsomia candida]
MAGNQENFDSKNTSTYNGTPESPPRVDTELGRRRHSSSPIPLVRRSHDESDADEEESKRDKKFVRFVDTLGLQLTSVKLFHHDELPNVPESAFNHLSLTSRTSSPPKQSDVLLPTFRQPGTLANFIVRLSEQKVLLESCQASAEDSVTVLSGEVKVVNVWFHKAVWVRYSYDGWASFAEIQKINPRPGHPQARPTHGMDRHVFISVATPPPEGYSTSVGHFAICDPLPHPRKYLLGQ